MGFRKGKDAAKDPERAVIARHLAAHGPTAGDELAKALKITPEWFWVLVNHPWFEITGKGWDLTAQGRDEGLATGG